MAEVTKEKILSLAQQYALPGNEAKPEVAEESSDQEEVVADETPEIKLETAPIDFRFPTTNQSRHCFTRYMEHHRCVAAIGEENITVKELTHSDINVDRWNEQRENGTFPGPL
ncbi:hypothetical protein C5167_039918 [Papaver somniferum]|uniref:Uncharacterized protein n=1 Tax=Papaver somniferum TaxID=3469 RepID=A0A4Y7IHP0_PAPSO|nr:hypothetical protein C5167_039918 [Papaver somniferum]